jgi:hypothetical protein
MFSFTPSELKIFTSLSTPIKIQDYLDAMPTNWEKKGETCMSPRRVLANKKAHCLEGAMLAAAALWVHGEPPLLFDLKTANRDDHVVALYRRNGYWGAISKTNHATLRFRDPVYKTLRELALSYFHEYFDNATGKKILRAYSAKPFDLRQYGDEWITSEEELFHIDRAIDRAPHVSLMPKKNGRMIRLADKIERKAGRITEWRKSDPRT